MRKMKPSIEVLEEIQTTQSKKDERKPFTSKQTQKCIKRFLRKAGLVGVGGGSLISSPEGGLLIGVVIELKLPMIAVKL